MKNINTIKELDLLAELVRTLSKLREVYVDTNDEEALVQVSRVLKYVLNRYIEKLRFG